MRYLILLAALMTGTLWAAGNHPDDGLYTCVQGNNDSICDQQIRMITKLGKVVEMRVMYEGYCNGQGPYTYECERNVCTDGAIKVTYESPIRYRWENLSYGFSCEMEKKF